MTTGLTYSSYVNQIATLAVVPSTDPNFVSILPQMITYAENRIYRDLDLLSTTTSNSSYFLTQGSRTLSVPSGTFVTVQQLNVIYPANVTNPDQGTRISLLPTTKEFLDNVYNSPSVTGTPQYFAVFQDNTYYVGPWPDANYTVEIVGTIRPNSLSASNTTTFISLYLPDLFIMASMVYISAYQRNFGRMSDDPAMAQSYEGQYQVLLRGATVEEYRKKFEAAGWTSMSPAAPATPTRG